MRTALGFLALLFSALAGFTPGIGADDGLSYTLPKGWQESVKDGVRILMPGDLKEGEAFLVMIPAPGAATEDKLEAQFETLAKKANEGSTQTAAGGVTKVENGAHTIFLQAFQVEDSEVGKHLRLVAGVFGAGRRVVAIVLISPDALVSRYDETFTQFVKSIRLKAPAEPAESSKPPNARKAPTGDTPTLFPGMQNWLPSGRGVPLPETAIVNGRPQGIWYRENMLSSDPQATTFVFFPDGTYLTGPRWGGGSIIDVEAQRQITPTSVGTYRLEGGKLSTHLPGFNAKAEAFTHGKDAHGTFFKYGAAPYRPLTAATKSKLVGKWRVRSTQYEFLADGAFRFGTAVSTSEWDASSLSGGKYYLDGRLLVMEFDGLPMTIASLGVITDDVILIGITKYFRVK